MAQLPPAPARIADMGCGTGTLAVLLGEAGYRCSGIDLAPRMVARAREKAANAGVEADFAVADAAAPPWAPGGFDVVLARHVVWALPDPGRALERWLTLLAPGGELLLIEGRWCTGAGLTGEQAMALVRAQEREAVLTPLTDPELWGGMISDERYLLRSPANGATSTQNRC